MLVVTTDSIPGREIHEALGISSGSTVQSKNAFKDIGAGFKSLVGGELKSYTDLMNKARNEAIRLMIEDAKRLGADAIVGFKLQTSAVTAGASEVIAYGTAVRLISKPI